jgi:hypothetical protein
MSALNQARSSRHGERLLACLVFTLSFHMALPSAMASYDENRERAAKKACLAGDVAKGVSILADLYARTDDLTYIFNQGRCLEQNGKYEQAILLFREFMLKEQDAGKQPDPVAERHIANCQALLDQQRQRDQAVASSVGPIPSPAAATPPPMPEPTAVPGNGGLQVPASGPAVPVASASNAELRADANQEGRAAGGSGLRVAGIATMAAGLAGLTAGIVLNVKANSLASEIETGRPYLRSQENSRASYETWGWVGYGVGGACLAGGAILYYLGYARGKSSRLTFVPSITAHAFGTTVRAPF